MLMSMLSFAGCKSQKANAYDIVLDTPGKDRYAKEDSLSGVYKNCNDGSTLTITKAEDGRYNISISLVRLTVIDDGIGTLKNGRIVFTGTDASGNPISGIIKINGDDSIVMFTDSTWQYLPDGATFTFERDKSCPHNFLGS